MPGYVPVKPVGHTEAVQEEGSGRPTSSLGPGQEQAEQRQAGQAQGGQGVGDG